MNVLYVSACCIFANLILAQDIQYMEMAQNDGEKLTWNNCNKTAVPLFFTNLSISPETVQLGHTLKVSAKAQVMQELVAPIKADISIKLKINDQYTEMCDLINKCHVGDICALLRLYFSQEKHVCPDIVKKQGSNCECPLKPKTYSIENFEFKIPQPTFEIYGTFKLTVKMTNKEKEIGNAPEEESCAYQAVFEELMTLNKT